jgi:hypothetical protein
MSLAFRSEDTDRQTELYLDARLGAEMCGTVVRNSGLTALRCRYDSLDQLLEAIVHIGVTGLLAVSSGFDSTTLRRELDATMDSTITAVDRVNARLTELLDDLSTEDGTFSVNATRTVGKAGQVLADLMKSALTEQADPAQAGSLMSRIAGATKDFDKALNETRREIGVTMQQAAERQSDKIEKALREMRDLDSNSPMGKAIAELKDGLKDVTVSLAATQAAAAERHKGTAQGAEYEDRAVDVIADLALVYGDSVEHTGQQQGAAIDQKVGSKSGDVVSRVADGVNIVFEVMNRKRSQRSARAVREELASAMRNRQSPVAVAVLSSYDNPLVCGQPFQILDRDRNMYAVVWDELDGDLLALRVVYRLAREAALCANRRQGSIDADALRRLSQEIQHTLAPLGELQQQHRNIAGCIDKAIGLTDGLKREVSAAVNRLMESLDRVHIDDNTA